MSRGQGRHAPRPDGFSPAPAVLLGLLLLIPAAAACPQVAYAGLKDERSAADSFADARDRPAGAARSGGPSAPPAASVSASMASQAYAIPRVDTLISVTPEADLQIAEILSFRFEQGIFNTAFREVPHEGYDELADAKVYDSNRTLLASGFQYKAEGCRGKYRVTWFFNDTRAPANTSFFIFYEFKNALVSPGPYQSGVDWWVLGPDWDHFVENVTGTVRIPGNVTGSPLFEYRPRSGTDVNVINGDTFVTFYGRNVSAGEGFRVTAYFPRIKPLEIPIHRWLRENALLVAVVLGALLSLPGVLRTSAKEARRALARPTSAGPDPLPAALVSHLLRPRARQLHFALATAELARRGHLAVVKQPEQGSATISLAATGPPADLARHERVAFEEGAERGSVREIANHWPAVRKRFRDAVVDDAVERRHYSRAPSLLGYLPLLFLGGFLMVFAGVLWWVLSTYAPFWLVVFCGVLFGLAAGGAVTLVVGGLLGSYRTWSGDNLAGEWKRQAKEFRRNAAPEAQERLWSMADARSVHAAAEIDDRKQRSPEHSTPKMRWFEALE